MHASKTLQNLVSRLFIHKNLIKRLQLLHSVQSETFPGNWALNNSTKWECSSSRTCSIYCLGVARIGPLRLSPRSNKELLFQVARPHTLCAEPTTIARLTHHLFLASGPTIYNYRRNFRDTSESVIVSSISKPIEHVPAMLIFVFWNTSQLATII